MATSTAEGFGRLSPSGNVKWLGAHRPVNWHFLTMLSECLKLEIDSDGNVTEKIWEWE